MPHDNNRPDLAFAPVVCPRPGVLNAEQISHYNREGFVSPLDVFTPSEAAANRAYFDGLLAQVPGEGAYSINCYQARCRGIWDLCTQPRILDLVGDIVGPNIICLASHFFCKLPHDPKRVPWHQDASHQDASFWGLSPAGTVTVWLAIDDADVGNAAKRFIPRTHAMGHLEFRNAGEGSALRLETAGAEQLGGQRFDNVLQAGQVSLHADMLVHGSRPNTSDRRRAGLTIRYCPPEVEFTDATWARSVEAIVCRGRDPYRHWCHHPCPRGDVPRVPTYLQVGMEACATTI